MRLREDIGVLVKRAQYIKALISETIFVVKDRVLFVIRNNCWNIKLTEVYSWDDKLHMDNIAFERLSIMIFSECVDYVKNDDRKWLLVYLQKKYSKNFFFEDIQISENTEDYATNCADTIAVQIIQLFVDHDAEKYDDDRIQKEKRAKWYFEIWLLEQEEYQKILWELQHVLEC